MTKKTKTEYRFARARKTHAKARIAGRPRLLVKRSNRTIYAQIIDDANGKVICGTSGLKSSESGIAYVVSPLHTAEGCCWILVMP